MQLTNAPSLDALAAFSPDGTKIVFVSDRAQKDSRKLFVMSAAGGAATRLIQRSGYSYQMVPDWQPLWAKDPCTIRGTINGDSIDGTAGPDVICGLGGSDMIDGLAGDDRIEEAPATTGSTAAPVRTSCSAATARHAATAAPGTIASTRPRHRRCRRCGRRHGRAERQDASTSGRLRDERGRPGRRRRADAATLTHVEHTFVKWPKKTNQPLSSPGGAASGASGSSTRNVAPPSGRGATETLPSCASAIAATIERPRPTPPLSRERDVSAR